MTPAGAQLLGYHAVALRVRFNEVDQYGYFWHGHALSHFECLRMDLARSFGLSTAELFAQDLMLPMLETRCVYKNPCRDDEDLVLQGSLLRLPIANPFMHFVYRAVNAATGRPAFLGQTRQVFARRDGRAVTRVPEPTRACVDRLAAHLASRPVWEDAAGILHDLGIGAAAPPSAAVLESR